MDNRRSGHRGAGKAVYTVAKSSEKLGWCNEALECGVSSRMRVASGAQGSCGVGWLAFTVEDWRGAEE